MMRWGSQIKFPRADGTASDLCMTDPESGLTLAHDASGCGLGAEPVAFIPLLTLPGHEAPRPSPLTYLHAAVSLILAIPESVE